MTNNQNVNRSPGIHCLSPVVNVEEQNEWKQVKKIAKKFSCKRTKSFAIAYNVLGKNFKEKMIYEMKAGLPFFSIIIDEVHNFKCLENGCNNSFQHNEGLTRHLTEHHGLKIEYETLEFSAREDFLAWKGATEKKDKSYYVVSKTATSEDKKLTYYTCNRSGKIKSRCTETVPVVKVTEHNNKLTVFWVRSHYGHAPELQHIRLPEADKSAVASKLILGVPASRILDSYRDMLPSDISGPDQLNREDILTRKDISNIKISYHINISEGVKDENDAVSVDLWVKQSEHDECNPVLFYKKQGVADGVYSLRVSDFCLVIMTSFQKNMLEKFGTNIIALDGTHGLNNYDFELTTILVVDEFGEGILVAFMFTNRKDTYIYEVFFSVIKLAVGVIVTKTFMTDIVFTFYSAWFSIMGPVIHQLFCSWHVDRAWQQNLLKIKDKVKRKEAYKTIKFLHRNTSSETTLNHLLSDVDTKDFGIYFTKHYKENYKKWAYCFRTGCGINTNMRLESMHKVLKYCYLDGKKVKRLDRSIHVLLKFVRDKYIERNIKKIKGKHTVHTKQIVLRHMTAESSEFITEIIKEAEWIVSSESKELYCVKKNKNESCCDYMCSISFSWFFWYPVKLFIMDIADLHSYPTICNICYHTYSCTCNDFITASSICKHIHYIEMKYYGLKQNRVNKERQENAGLVRCTQNKLDVLRERISRKIALTMNKLDMNKNGFDETKMFQIENHLDLINKLIDLPSDIPTESFTPINSQTEPANKKISKQKNFYSTQKKVKTKKNKVKKPNETEVMNISSNLNSSFSGLYVSNSETEDHKYF
ncbi:uncharacterized protein LOC123673658 [Harmonia axyridis]|uniref:uncharacterized protein LOC123673658 n=1 Tax=Harmonia axyridis TaxID=115357 RepID=UPI001E277E39|nr:uncharacterized protein LOC123673658 [Harmonia axyridis]